MTRAILAMELIPAIRARMELLDREPRRPLTSGERAALWRAQQHAARVERTVEDLRMYCLEALGARQVLRTEDENDYLRGYRLGFQAVLREIRRIEARR